MTIYYRVDLENGITPEERPGGFYSKSPELNVTVFKALRAAKRAFLTMTSSEIDRIKALRRKFSSVVSRTAAVTVNPPKQHEPEQPDE